MCDRSLFACGLTSAAFCAVDPCSGIRASPCATMSGLTADAVDAHTKNARGLSDLVDVASSNSSSSKSSHRYLGEKKCKLCKKTSTAPNVISKGPFSVNEYIIWNS